MASLLPSLGRTVGTGIRAARVLFRGSVRGGAWATRRVGSARARGAAGEIGMIRLFDLHALSCAGDTLIAIGLAGTIFFNVPLGEARSKVALYLLITMVPFALLAPVVGPLLDHFRHGRRYALAVTMLGRAFLAYVISDNLFGWGLYPAAFGVLALSRAYGVARSAAVPRLLPEGVGLSQVGARASVYGTFAGAVVAPIGLLAFKFGPQWPLRVATIIFVVGMVVALRLPPRADSDPPEAVPAPWRTMLRLGRGEDRPISGRLIVSTLIGSASLRLLYGFLLLYLTFVIMANQLDTTLLGSDIGRQGAVGLIGGALVVGTFLSTAVGTRLRIRRPLALQSAGLTITAGVAVLCAIFYNLTMLALLALITAIISGIAKLAIDASIQERAPERLRASAFAHSETVLMIAWVVGGAIGIIPLPGRVGVALAAFLAVAAAVRAGIVAARLHGERLSGRADHPTDAVAAGGDDPEAGRRSSTDGHGGAGGVDTAAGAAGSSGDNRPDRAGRDQGRSGRGRSGVDGSSRGAGLDGSGRGDSDRGDSDRGGFGRGGFGRGDSDRGGFGRGGFGRGGFGGDFSDEPADPWPDAPTVPVRSRSNGSAPRSRASEEGHGNPRPTGGGTPRPTGGSTPRPSGGGAPRPPGGTSARDDGTNATGGRTDRDRLDTTKIEPPRRGSKWSFGRRKARGEQPPDAAQPPRPVVSEPMPAEVQPDPAMAPPGFHVYRPSSASGPGSDGSAAPSDDR